MKFEAAIAVFVLALSFAGPVNAQEAGNSRAKASKAKVIEFTELRIEGVIQKPEAFYILQRSELNFKGLEPKKSFLPLILKSVEKEPF